MTDPKFQTPEGVRWLWRQHVARTLEDAAKRAINHNRRVANLNLQDLSQAFWPQHLPHGYGVDDPWLAGRHLEPAQSLMGLQMLGYTVSLSVLHTKSGHFGTFYPIGFVDRDGRDLLALARDVIDGKGGDK